MHTEPTPKAGTFQRPQRAQISPSPQGMNTLQKVQTMGEVPEAEGT